MDGLFKFEDCLLKHYIRKEAWLPRCKLRRRALLKVAKKETNARRLKYFTFCAVGALDVLMLDLERVIRRSKETKRFDTVYFFDVDPDYVRETQKRIPGANGFVGDFVEAVLVDDPDELLAINNPDPLDPPSDEENTAEVRKKQRLRQTKQLFIRSFPFDVINLDLETYLFKPKEGIPGKVINCFRKIFEWQRQAETLSNGHQYQLSEFTLMFTTRVGPPNLGADYIEMIKGFVDQNLAQNAALKPIYLARSKNRESAAFLQQDFAEFFKLAVPKTIASLLWEQDWEIDAKNGVQVFQFERNPEEEPYEMLHFVMDVRRINPPRDRRPPNQFPVAALDNYAAIVNQLFATQPQSVMTLLQAAGEDLVKAHLDRIKTHRDKIYSR